MNSNMKFIEALTKLQPVEFAAVARILNVRLLNEDKEPRDFTEVLNDIMQHFGGLSRAAKRNLIRVVKAGGK